nr:hypothetical protein [Legionella jordanis]
MFTFFEKPKIQLNESEIGQVMANVRHHFAAHPELTKLIESRQDVFQHQLNLTTNPSERKKLLLSYALFAETLLQCTKATAEEISDLAQDYYSSSYYRHIGGDQGCYSMTYYDEVNNHIFNASLALMVFSILLFPLSMIGSLSLLAIAVTVILPSAYYDFVETWPNQLKIQKEEETLFTQIAHSLVGSNIPLQTESQILLQP